MYRVMIVDDEPFMLEGLRMMVDWSRFGFALCGEASTAQEALHKMEIVRPHLLMTDVQMPGMLGTDLAAIVSRYHPETVIVFFSGFREFAYAQSAIRTHAFGYLTKPIDVDEVIETLQKVKAELDARAQTVAAGGETPFILRELVLRRIALGDDSPESLMRAAILIEIKRGEPCYCAVLTHEQGHLPDSLRMLLTTCGAVPFQLSYRQYGLGFRQIDRNLPLLQKLAASVVDTCTVRWSVGNIHHGAEGFRISLREALDAQGVLFEPFAMIRLYHPFDIQTAKWLAQVQPLQLYEAVQDGDPTHLDKALAALRTMVKEKKPSYFALRYLANTVDAMLPTSDDAKDVTLLHALWQEQSLTLQAWVDAFCIALAKRQASGLRRANANLPPPVLSAMAAIHTRYSEPLSMASIAKELHMNPAYLGQLVRRHTGATFHHRLLETRMSHACVSLRQTNRSVSAIALDVGFQDVDYFSQQFRAHMGMSPMAYRSAEATREGEDNAAYQ